VCGRKTARRSSSGIQFGLESALSQSPAFVDNVTNPRSKVYSKVSISRDVRPRAHVQIQRVTRSADKPSRYITDNRQLWRNTRDKNTTLTGIPANSQTDSVARANYRKYSRGTAVFDFPVSEGTREKNGFSICFFLLISATRGRKTTRV